MIVFHLMVLCYAMRLLDWMLVKDFKQSAM